MRHSIDDFLGNHSEQKMIAWAKRLKYFYLFGRFVSGQVYVEEELVCRIRYENRDDFVSKVTKLIDLKSTPSDIASLPKTVFSPSPIYFFPEFLEPRNVQIKDCILENTFCFINVGQGFFDISLHGDGKENRFDISDYSIEAALQLEKVLQERNLTKSVVHEIAEHFNCISAFHYASLFE